MGIRPLCCFVHALHFEGVALFRPQQLRASPTWLHLLCCSNSLCSSGFYLCPFLTLLILPEQSECCYDFNCQLVTRGSQVTISGSLPELQSGAFSSLNLTKRSLHFSSKSRSWATHPVPAKDTAIPPVLQMTVSHLCSRFLLCPQHPINSRRLLDKGMDTSLTGSFSPLSLLPPYFRPRHCSSDPFQYHPKWHSPTGEKILHSVKGGKNTF